MKTEKLFPGMELQSGTTYRFEGERCDVTFADVKDGPDIWSVGKSVAFLAKDKRDITLDFGGATLYLHGKIQPFWFDHCERITVKNVTVQYDRSSVTEGLITGRGDGFIRVKLNPKHPCRVEDGQLIPYSETWENHELNRYCMFMTALDAKSGEGLGFTLGLIGRDPWVSPENPWSESATLFSVGDAGGGEIILGGPSIPDCFRPGAVLVLSHEKREVSAFSCVDCTDVRIENFRILNGISMGIMPIHTKNVTVDGLKMFRDGSSDAYTSNGADGIHSFAVSGKFVIENSVLEGMVDDAINVHGYFYRVEKIEGDRMTLVFPGRDDTRYKIFAPGERVRVYRGSTLSGGVDYVAKCVTVLDAKHLLILLDRPAGDHKPGDAVENPDAVCDLILRNCTLGRSAASHCRFQNGGKLLIEDCTTEFPFLMTGDMSFWYEASYVPDCTVRRCRFSGGRANIESTAEFFPTDDAPYYHRRVTVEDCIFDTDVPVKLRETESLAFRRNENAKGNPMRVELIDCGDFSGEGCEVVRSSRTRESLSLN